MDEKVNLLFKLKIKIAIIRKKGVDTRDVKAGKSRENPRDFPEKSRENPRDFPENPGKIPSEKIPWGFSGIFILNFRALNHVE